MVKTITRVKCAASKVDTASSTSSRQNPSPISKDKGHQPIANPASAPPITGTGSHFSYNPSDATTPALIADCGASDNVSSTILPDQLLEVLPGGRTSSTQSLPSTITPVLLQPALQDFSPSKQNADGRYSAAAKGKGKVPPEEQPSSGKDPVGNQLAGPLEELDAEDLSHPSPEFSSTEQWVAHTRPILQDYANRQIALPLGQRINVSLNEHSQFIQGAMQLLVNRDHPQDPPVEPSRQLGPQLLENFTDVHKWATEYFRTRFGMSTAGSDIPVLLTIITNTFYEAHTQLIDSIARAALDNMRTRGAASLDIEDFAFGYDFEMSQDLPFAAESSSRIHDTLERHRPRSPLEIPVNLPVITRSGRQSKPSKQAQAAAQAENEKQMKARQLKKEKAKKKQELESTSRFETPKAVSEESQTKETNVVMRTPSAVVYHTPNHGSLSRAPWPKIVVFTGAKCPTCSRVMPPRMPASPTNPDSTPQCQSTASLDDWNLHRATIRPPVSSNLRLAPPITVRLPPSAVPLPTGLPPSPFHAPSTQPTSEVTPTATALPTSSTQIPTGSARSAPTSEAITGTSTYQDPAQVQATFVRGGGRTVRARGARGARANRGNGRAHARGGRASAPITITIPARPRPLAPASTAPPTASASTEAIAPTDAVRSYPLGGGTGTTATYTTNPVPTTHAENVRSDYASTTGGGASHSAAVTASASTYDPLYHYTQTTTARSTANTAVNAAANTTANNAANNTANTSGLYGYSPGMVSYPGYYSSTTIANTTADTAASSSRGRPIDFSDLQHWIAHVRAAGDFRAEVPQSVASIAVAAANGGGIHTTPSSSHVETLQNKKRKLDGSE